MRQQLRAALVSLALLTLVTGVVYPLVVTGIARAAFPRKSGGSLIVRDGRATGSELIGQPFDDPRYFWGRPSATVPYPYNPAASAGSNMGPTNPSLADSVKARIEALRAADPGNTSPVPDDLVTASGSGLDPHISVPAALYQTQRVARARGAGDEQVRLLVRRHVEGRQFGVLGEPRVNVLKLNLALDAMSREGG
jgi:potassium-transporting ATPase KdpC subunit